MAGVYVLCSGIIVSICVINRLYIIGWMILIGAIEHFHYQWEYKTIEASNAMAFAGLRYVDDRLLLHMLVNQSKLESLDIGEDVAKILATDMYDRDGGYFFNYLCLSGMFYEWSKGELKEEFKLLRYMDQKVDDIIESNETALNLVKYADNDVLYKHLEKKICLFYDSYREFLLYALMYYKLKEDKVRFQQLKNYIEYMLEEVESKCVNDSLLSNHVLSSKFEEYQNLYQKVLEGRFEPEKSIFTGYETLPVWKEQREKFISEFHLLSEYTNRIEET